VQLGFEAHKVTPTVCPCHLFFPSCHRLSQRKSTEAQPKQQQLAACRALHALTACRALLLQRPSRNITSHTIMVCQGCFHRLLFNFSNAVERGCRANLRRNYHSACPSSAGPAGQLYQQQRWPGNPQGHDGCCCYNSCRTVVDNKAGLCLRARSQSRSTSSLLRSFLPC
jgi:hypothetical protein